MASPTPRELLVELAAKYKDLEARVTALETAPAADPDGWDTPIDLDEPAPPQRQATVTDGAVEIATPNPEQVALREQWAPALGFEHLPAEHGLSKEDAAAAYLKGGPMWLYLFDRDFVLTLPTAARSAMVQDVMLGGSPEEAHELARDLLKNDTDPRAAAEITVEHADREWEAKHGG